MMDDQITIKDAVAPGSTFTLRVTKPYRLDQFLAEHFSAYSRTFFSHLIRDGSVSVNDEPIDKTGKLLKIGDIVVVTFPALSFVKQKDALLHTSNLVQVIAVHEHFIILNKPPFLTVHTTSGIDTEPTLTDWLIAHYADLASVGAVDRPGIVHRLDKNTSGVIIIARTNYAYNQFSAMFKDRTIHKKYLAVVQGHPDTQGTIDIPIGRHPTLRHKMTTFTASSRMNQRTLKSSGVREAVTHYTVLQYYDNAALVQVKPITGRTHQIRVHMASIGHPIIGDSAYGSESPLITRQALHAQSISFTFDGLDYFFEAPIPDDIKTLIQLLV